MARPRMCRRVWREPGVTYFKPQGIMLSGLEIVYLNVEELEAVRLRDHEGLDQNSSAERMKVSQPTFHRVYSEARRKIARALVEGLALKIHGGVYKMPGMDRTGPQGQGPMTGRGMGQGGGGAGFGAGRGAGRRAGFGAGRGAGMGAGMGAGRGRFGAPEYCTCPSCGHRAIKQIGIPCAQMNCPKCNSPMVRG